MARILLADDERILTALWKIALVDAGHSVTVSHTGLQTVGYLQDKKFDLLITDMNMPDGGGFIVTMEADRINHKMPIIVVTGDAKFLSAGAELQAANLEYDEFVAKPIDTDDLLDLVETALNRRPNKTLSQRLGLLVETVRNNSRAMS